MSAYEPKADIALYRSTTGGFALVHSDSTARKASGVEILYLVHALTDQDGGKPGFAWLTAFNPGFHRRAGATRQRFFQHAALQRTFEWNL